MQKRAAFQTAGGQVILLSAFTLLVKAVGFVKQAIIAAYVGAGGATGGVCIICGATGGGVWPP